MCFKYNDNSHYKRNCPNINKEKIKIEGKMELFSLGEKRVGIAKSILLLQSQQGHIHKFSSRCTKQRALNSLLVALVALAINWSTYCRTMPLVNSYALIIIRSNDYSLLTSSYYNISQLINTISQLVLINLDYFPCIMIDFGVDFFIRGPLVNWPIEGFIPFCFWVD